VSDFSKHFEIELYIYKERPANALVTVDHTHMGVTVQPSYGKLARPNE
jgi:hypothetical protein